ncbi:hypothetical protein D3C86_1076540 [compost metagenome]
MQLSNSDVRTLLYAPYLLRIIDKHIVIGAQLNLETEGRRFIAQALLQVQRQVIIIIYRSTTVCIYRYQSVFYNLRFAQFERQDGPVTGAEAARLHLVHGIEDLRQFRVLINIGIIVMIDHTRSRKAAHLLCITGKKSVYILEDEVSGIALTLQFWSFYSKQL